MSRLPLKDFIKTIEEWGSETDERVKLLMTLIWIGLGGVVLIVVIIIAVVLLPPESWSF